VRRGRAPVHPIAAVELRRRRLVHRLRDSAV
jgi:hypothetical protein